MDRTQPLLYSHDKRESSEKGGSRVGEVCHKPFDKPLLILEKLGRPCLKGNPLGLSLHPSEILSPRYRCVRERSGNIENEMKTGRLNNPFQFAVNYLLLR